LLKTALHYGVPEVPVEVRWHEQDEQLVLEVDNGGEPIPKDLLPRIFDPFRRARGAHAELARDSSDGEQRGLDPSWNRTFVFSRCAR